MRLRTLHLCLLCLGITLACSAPRQNLKEEQPAPEEGGSEGFALVLNNRHYLDVNIFVQHDGQASRVGMVTGSSSTALAVPVWMMGKGGLIRLIAEPIGDQSRYVTDNLLVQRGQVVELNVESSIGRSNYSVQ